MKNVNFLRYDLTLYTIAYGSAKLLTVTDTCSMVHLHSPPWSHAGTLCANYMVFVPPVEKQRCEGGCQFSLMDNLTYQAS